ncbi:MAG: phosphodiester glycosidase family protein, partial [Defluviitaleaceae bacterium]|nr:phosphodiester glycosidase family protein [Defluviitaleaceae bacterium]
MKIKKKVLTLVAASAVLSVFAAVPVSASTIHTYSRTTPISVGVDYIQQRRITRAGRVDAHIITVDLDREGITLGPVTPAFGGRNTTTNLLADANAIAGINADFFDMRRNPVTAMGQVIRNGEVRELNETDPGFATFMLDVYNNPLIKYIQPKITFLNNNRPGFSIRAYNHLSNQIVSTVFDRRAFHNTARLVERHPYVVSIVVDNGVIINITEPGEAVYIPRYGFIIAIRDSYFEYFKNSTLVGNTAEIVMGAANVDLNSIWQAVSGAGEILRNGTIVNTGYVPGPNARHPRSAVGISEDGQRVFLVAVDGRGASIGATHAELGQILLSLGAHNAMHFDGGGSTTMAIERPGGSLSLVNRPSDGSQRRVVNALGVFNTAPRDVISQVELHSYPSSTSIFIGDHISLYGVARNTHLERLSLDSAYLNIEAYPYTQRSSNRFFPSAPGSINFNMEYREHRDELSINVLELARIVPNEASLSLQSGASASLTFTGIDPFGHSAPLRNINIELFPADFANWDEETNTLTITGDVSGILRASRGSIATYISVNVNEAGHTQTSAPTVIGNP